jgi:hypothetical protein
MHCLNGGVLSLFVSEAFSQQSQNVMADFLGGQAFSLIQKRKKKSEDSDVFSQANTTRSSSSSFSRRDSITPFKKDSKVGTVVDSACVHTCTPRNRDWMYTVEIVSEKEHWICSRDYREFWDLHMFIFETFPSEAGRTGRRAIPFMDPPPKRDINYEEAEFRAQILNHYISELLKLNLPGATNHSFFDFRSGDYRDNMFATSMDLLLDLNSPSDSELPLTIKVYDGAKSESWDQFSPIAYQSLMLKCLKLFPGLKMLTYKNELGRDSILTNDQELHFLSYKRKKLIFSARFNF